MSDDFDEEGSATEAVSPEMMRGVLSDLAEEDDDGPATVFASPSLEALGAPPMMAATPPFVGSAPAHLANPGLAAPGLPPYVGYMAVAPGPAYGAPPPHLSGAPDPATQVLPPSQLPTPGVPVVGGPGALPNPALSGRELPRTGTPSWAGGAPGGAARPRTSLPPATGGVGAGVPESDLGLKIALSLVVVLIAVVVIGGAVWAGMHFGAQGAASDDETSDEP